MKKLLKLLFATLLVAASSANAMNIGKYFSLPLNYRPTKWGVPQTIAVTFSGLAGAAVGGYTGFFVACVGNGNLSGKASTNNMKRVAIGGAVLGAGLCAGGTAVSCLVWQYANRYALARVHTIITTDGRKIKVKKIKK